MSLNDYLPSARQSLNFSGKIELPFDHLKLWWKNGSAQQPKTEIVAHFGGWGCQEQDAQAYMDATGKPMLTGFELKSYTSKENKDYSAYVCRSVLAVLIQEREAWFQRDDGKNYSVVNMLVYLASSTQNKDKQRIITPYGYGVMSAKGFSGLALKAAFKEWDGKTASLRSATKYPSNWFWGLFGTFGPEIKTESKGKAQKSPITPCYAFIPEKLSAEALQSRFIGEALVEEIYSQDGSKALAQEWADDWNKREGAQQEQPQGAEAGQEDERPVAFADENNIPF